VKEVLADRVEQLVALSPEHLRPVEVMLRSENKSLECLDLEDDETVWSLDQMVDFDGSVTEV
jgi:hypothetical protein